MRGTTNSSGNTPEREPDPDTQSLEVRTPDLESDKRLALGRRGPEALGGPVAALLPISNASSFLDGTHKVLRRQIRLALRSNRAPSSDLDDLEQDVMIAVLREGACRGQLSTWIWSVCRNKVHDHRRHERLRSSLRTWHAESLQGSIAGPDDHFRGSDASSLVYLALSYLPRIARSVVYLRAIRGASYEEISRELKVTREAARAAYHRGLASLRHHYLFGGRGFRRGRHSTHAPRAEDVATVLPSTCAIASNAAAPNLSSTARKRFR